MLYSRDADRRSRRKITDLEIRKNQSKNRPPLKNLAPLQDHQGTLKRRRSWSRGVARAACARGLDIEDHERSTNSHASLGQTQLKT